MKNHLQNILAGYVDLYGETESVQAFRIFMDAHPQLASRKNLAGHVTGSALVWHRPSHSVLRVHHAKLNCWVFSAGGHIDDGEWPWQASVRELREETGIVAKPLFNEQNPIPLIVDVQPIPASVKKNEPAHWHYDVVYLFEVEQKPEIQADPAEILHFRWFDVAEVTQANSPVDLGQQMLSYGA
jgi:8-oxo-dGTP pyrophosphatase MutT (NUDIX family)